MAHGDITHLDIPYDDLDRATSFYSGVFGWSIEAPPGFEDYPMWQAPNQLSGGGFTSRDSGLSQIRNYVEVDSIDEALERVAALGGRVTMSKTPISDTSWYAVFEDTEGNEMGLYEGVTDTSD